MEKLRLSRIILAGVLVGSFVMSSARVWADDTEQLKQQVQALQNRVNELEAEQSQDPFMQMMQMRQQMDRNMSQAFADTGTFTPRMDIKQTDKAYIITMDIPGMDKNKINVEIKNGILTVSGERQTETQDNNYNQYYRQERSFGSFMQAIPLPEDIKPGQVDAGYKNGVLTLTVARMTKEEKKSENERITVR